MRISRFNLLVLLAFIFFSLLLGVAGGVYLAKRNIDTAENSSLTKNDGNVFPLTKNDADQFFLYCQLVDIKSADIALTGDASIRYTGTCQYLNKNSKLSQITLPLGMVNNTSKESLILGYGVYDDVFADKAMETMLSKFIGKNVVVTFFDETPKIVNTENRTPEQFLSTFSNSLNTLGLITDFVSTGETKKLEKLKNEPAFFVTNMTEVQL